MTVEWTTDDEALAATRGWGLHGVYDGLSGKYLGLQAFSAQGVAFQQIKDMAARGDALSLRALRAIYQSRVPAKQKGRR